ALTMRWRQCARLLHALERTLAAFATGDTGGVIASILAGRPRRPVAAAAPAAAPEPWVAVRPRPDERRFAFLLHPLDAASIADFDRSLACLSGPALEEVSRKIGGILEPFVLSRGRGVSKA